MAIASGDVNFNSAIAISGAASTLSTTGGDATIFTSGANATIFTTGAGANINTDGEYATISTGGAEAAIFTGGASAFIYTDGANANIYTSGANANIYTNGESANIYTSGGNANIYTSGADAYIQTRSTFKLSNGTHITTLSHAPTANRAIAFPNASGTVALTSQTVLKSDYTPAHSLLVQQSSTGSPSSLSVGTNTILGRATGGGSDIAALTPSQARTVMELTALATTTPAANVATFLATPSSANLAAAVTDETGTGSLVFGTSPSITTPTIAQINGGTAANDDLTLQGTTNATRTTSYVILQPTAGNVGIGTSTPQAKLEINDATLANFRLNNTNSTAGAGASQLQFFAGSSPSAANAKNFAVNNTNGTSGDENHIAFQSRNDDGTFKAILFRIYQNSGNVIVDAGSFAVGTATPSAKALVDLTSTTKGFLPPRMTTAQRDAITSVPAGLMIYNTTTNKLNVYTTAWEAVTSL